MDTAKRAVAYCRVSTDMGGQLNSFDNQVDIYTEKIKNDPGLIFCGIYADAAVTGTSAERPQFQRMMRDAEKNKFDLIFCKSISRFARNTVLAVESVRHLKELGIAVKFEKENIDTSEPYSEMMLTILAAFAQEESRSTSNRIIKGFQMRYSEGRGTWTPMYGYRKVNGVPFIIEENEAEVVKRIFSEYLAGKSAREISSGLNYDGIPTTNGKDWSQPLVMSILKNEKYTGDILTNKFYTKDHISHKTIRNRGEVEQILIEGNHKGIITREQFRKAQEICKIKLAGNIPYGNKLFCPKCGSNLVRKGKGWRCDCESFYIPNGKIDAVILKRYSSLPEECREKNTAPHQVDYSLAERLIDRIDFSEDGKRMVTGWKHGEITEDDTGFTRLNASLSRLSAVSKLREEDRETAQIKTVKGLAEITETA